jgi:exopolysaccharide production protein ExoZ
VTGAFARLGAHFELSDHNARLSAMEGLRGLAILLVFVCHYNGIIGEQLHLPPATAWASKIIGLGGASGVDLFFLLSGFLIYRSALRPNLNYLAFLRRRFERIYPTFLVVFALYLGLVGLHLAPSRIPPGIVAGGRYLVENLLFLPGIFDIRAFIGAAWSLSYEWFFYLTIPFVVHAFQLHRWPRARRMLFFAIVVAVYLTIVVAFGGHFPAFQWYDGTRIRLIMFISGILVYEVLESARLRALLTPKREWVLVAVALASGAAILFMCAVKSASGSTDGEWTAQTGTLQVIPTFIGCVALALVTLRPGGLLVAAFSRDWLRWTGNISYSFYLMHSIPMHVVAIALTHGPLAHLNPLLVYIVAFPFTVAFVYVSSALLFVLIERPLSLRPRRDSRTARTQLQAA